MSPMLRVWMLAMLLVLPSLGAGLFADDYGHRFLLVEQSHELFSFLDNDPSLRQLQYGYGMVPWWSSESLSLRFFRPLADITHRFDYWLYPDSPWRMHLQSLVWYGLLLFVVMALYRKLFAALGVDGKLAAFFAFLFFAVDATHGMTVAWIANRNALLAALCGMLAFYCHIRSRWLLSALLFGMSLLSAECGVATFGFLAGFALFLDERGIRSGLLALLPAALVLLVWLVAYRVMGYGVVGSAGFYIDPFHNLSGFLWQLPEKILVALSALFHLLPFHLVSYLHGFVLVSGLLIFLLLGWWAWKCNDPLYRFFLCALVVSILPATVTVMQDRNLLFASVAAAGLLARITLWLRDRSRAGQALILFFHVLVSAMLMVPAALAPALLAKNAESLARALPVSEERAPVISFGMPLYDASFVALVRHAEGLPLPERFWNITTCTEGVVVERIGSGVIRVSSPAGLLRGDDLLFRDLRREPFVVGQWLDRNGLQVRVVAVGADGVPTIIELVAPAETVVVHYR